jgi:hypothetical protein
MKTCPNCSQRHEEEVITCDCGFDFYSPQEILKLQRENLEETDNTNTRSGNGWWNILVGAVFIMGGLSGGLVLRGTNSGVALAIFGVGLVIWGAIRLLQDGKL